MLSDAFEHLTQAQAALQEFAELHPGRMDTHLTDALEHSKLAAQKMDADFYTEHEALPLREERFLVTISTRASVIRDRVLAALESYFLEEETEGIDVEHRTSSSKHRTPS